MVVLPLLAAAAFAEEAPAARMIATTRGSVAVPADIRGVAQSFSAEVGAQFKGGQAVALRFALVPDPPDVLGADTPNLAAGPVFVWSYHVKVAPRFDISPSVGLGAVFGTSPASGENQVLPYIQGDVGLRYRVPLDSGAELAIMPSMGVVPTILAPMVALSVGFVGAP